MSACSSNSIQDNPSPHEILSQKYIALQEQCEKLKNEAQQNKAEIENLISTNKKLQLSADESRNTLDGKLKELLGGFLTQNQIEVLLKNKTKARWTSEEISKAFTLRYFSKRAYIYVKISITRYINTSKMGIEH